MDEPDNQHLINQLCEQDLINNIRSIAEQIADVAGPESFQLGEKIYDSGDRGDEQGYILFLVLVGKVELRRDGRLIALIEAGDHFGEFPLVDTEQLWTVDARAASRHVDVVKLRERDFLRIADNNPALWKRMARSLVKRLASTFDGFAEPNPVPQVFLGSASGPGLTVASDLELLFEHDTFEVRIWNSMFPPGRTTIETLEQISTKCDLAIMIATPEDSLRKRDTDYAVMRDNVLFEFGLFIGVLGRDRALLVQPNDGSLHLPSDLNGLTTIRYRSSDQLGPTATQIRNRVRELGPVLDRLASKRRP